ncbi:hypothetical protein BGW41_001942 [Actinomortierella wolfii]|nr:hypothetical protein BGW41_001942 [Actinomortierella wolfii]
MLAIQSSAAYFLQENESRADLGGHTPSSTAASTAASVSRLHHHHLQQQRLDRADHHLRNLTMKEFFLHRQQHALHAQQFHNTPAHLHQRSLSHPHQRTITTTTTTTTTTTASDFDLFSIQQHHRLHSLHLHQQQQQLEQFQQQQQQQAQHHANVHSIPSTANSRIVHNTTPTATTAVAPFVPTTSASAPRASQPTVVAVNQHSATVQQQQQQRASPKPSRPFLLPNHKRRHPNHLQLSTTSSPKTQTASPPSSPTKIAVMTPTAKIEARMARLDSDDLAKEKIVLLLTGR